MNTLSRSLLVPGLCAVLAACATQPTPPPDPAGGHPLLTSQGAWRLVSASDAAGTALIPAGTDYRLQFVDQRLNILGGCNRMAGGYAVTGNTLRVEALASTRMACEPMKMQNDAALSKLLDQSLSMTTTRRQPPQLRLVTPGGDVMLFNALPLE